MIRRILSHGALFALCTSATVGAATAVEAGGSAAGAVGLAGPAVAAGPTPPEAKRGVRSQVRCSTDAETGATDCAVSPLPRRQLVRGDGTVVTQPEFALDSTVTLFFPRPARGTRSFARVEWSRTPGAKLVASVYPKGVAGGGYAHLICFAAADRSLERCRVDGRAFPPDQGFEQAFLQLAKEFRLAENAPPADQTERVGVDLYLRHRGEAPCPMCPPTPPPPPEKR